MSIVLHDYWRSSAAYRVRIALALKGLAYTVKTVDLLAGEQRSAAHLAVNPQGLVPALEIDGIVLTQSLAIIEYLEETRPEIPLLPKHHADRAKVRAVALAIAADLHPVANLRILNRVEALGGLHARAEWNRQTIFEGLAAVEDMLDDGSSFAFGDSATLADCVIVPQLYNAQRWQVDVTRFKRLARVADVCSQYDAFRIQRK